MATPHDVVNPASLAPAVGFAHAVVAAPGRLVFLGGQTATGPDGTVVGTTIAEQWDRAAANLVEALAAADAEPQHLVSMVVFTTDMHGYRASLAELGPVYRRHLGRHYPAMSLIGAAELFDPAALVELTAVAVVPDQGKVSNR